MFGNVDINVHCKRVALTVANRTIFLGEIQNQGCTQLCLYIRHILIFSEKETRIIVFMFNIIFRGCSKIN